MTIRAKFSYKLQISALAALSVAGAAFAADAPPAYVKTVMTQVSGKVEYPKMAKMRHQEGVVTLQLTIDGSGAAQTVVEKSSGIQSLDDAAVAAATAAAPFPAPPEAGTVVHGNIRFNVE
jgi:TonB family protein